MAEIPGLAGDVVGGGDSRPIPDDVGERVSTIRAAQLDALEDAAAVMDAEIGRAAADAIAKIKASGYSPAVIRRAADAMVGKSHDIARRVLAEQIQDAALYADRAGEVMRAWEIRERLGAGSPTPAVSASEVRRARQSSKVGADASMARDTVARLRTPTSAAKAMREYGASGAGKKPLDPRFSGDLAIRELRAKTRGAPAIKSRGEVSLSRRLHGSKAKNLTDTRRVIGRVIRETESYDRASSVLVREAKLGGRVKLTKPLKELQHAGRELARAQGGTTEELRAATKAWDRSFSRIKGIAGKLSDERGGYKELIQDLHGAKVQRLDSALEKWLSQKQRANADRIVKTETSAAYRAREWKHNSKKSYITGAYWRLNKGGRRGFEKRTKPTLRPTKAKWKAGKRCVCELLAGEFFSKDAIREYPRMGHTHCLCWWEWSYDREELLDGEVTRDDVDWYNSLED